MNVNLLVKTISEHNGSVGETGHINFISNNNQIVI